MSNSVQQDFHNAYPTISPVVRSARELIEAEIPPLVPILSPWLYEKCLAMVHSKRGVGKTHFALALADAVASGGEYLCWKSPGPANVLFIDGEMPVQLMQTRLREQAAARGGSSERLKIMTPDLQHDPMPDLGTLGGQKAIDAVIDTQDSKLIIVDNISCLVRSGGAENESESWGFVSDWALRHRRAGRSIIFLHHSGKSGAQRGTSKREDLLDVVISLKRPPEYKDEDGAVFEIHFEKARSIMGNDVAPIEAKLERMADETLQWTWRSVEVKKGNSICAMWNNGGLNITDIAREMEIHKSTVHRTLKAAMGAGQLDRPYPRKAGEGNGVAHATK